MRSVLFVLPATAIGGAEVRFSAIIRHIREVRSVLLTHSSVADYFSDLGITVRHFDEYGCHSPMPFSFPETVRYAKAVSAAVEEEKIDCLVGVMHVGTFYAAVARDMFRLRKPLIGTILGNISAYFDKAERQPTMVERVLLWYLLRRPSLLVVPSGGVKDDIVKNFRLSEERIRVIYNGIDLDRVHSLASETTDMLNEYDGKIIVTACRLNAQKDFFTLLEAFKEVLGNIQAKLVIVGDGELREEIVQYAIDINIEKDLVITGFQKNPFRFMKKANVFVLSSFFEGFGNVIVEAMSLGIPVVSTDCPSGPAEIIEDGVNGFLVPMKNHHVMADRILKLLTDEGLSRSIAVKGRLRASCFGIAPMVEKFRELIFQS